MRVILFYSCGLRPIAGVTFAAALAVGLVTPPMPQLISAAALRQQASAPDKKAKIKKPIAGQLTARERQKKHRAEWKEAKAAGKI
jgi:hypothetical protein